MRDFISLLRVACDVKLINCFLMEFSPTYFSDRGWSRVSETVESEIVGEGSYHIGFIEPCEVYMMMNE